jgi:hypothetical protein
MEKNQKIISLSDYSKEREIKAYLNLLRLGKVLEVINIDQNGIVDLYEFGIHRLGFVFGFDFVTFEENPQIYPINYDMDKDIYFTDDEPGIYVSKLIELPNNQIDEYYKLVENNIDLARNIEKMYFEKFINDETLEYSKDSRHLYIDDETYFKKQDCQVIDFNKAKKAINKKRVKDLVKNSGRF